MSRTRIEAAIGAARQAREFAKTLFSDWIITFLEHEGRNAEKSERTGSLAKVVELFLHRVPDEDQRLHFAALRLPLGMRDDLADLGMPAATIDLLHQRGEPFGLRHPLRRPTFADAAVIH